MKFEKLNIKNAKKAIDNLFKNWLNISLEIEDDYIEGYHTITTKAYDCDIHVFLQFFDTGRGGVMFFLGNIDKNEQTLDLVNTFNDDVLRLKSMISYDDNEKEYGLYVLHEIQYCTADTIAQIVEDAFDYLTDEYTIKYLKPLTKLLH